MAFVNIDAPGGRRNRAAVAQIQKRHGADERRAAAQARQAKKRAKRARGEATILLYTWPDGGISQQSHDGAYVQGCEGRYQVAIVGALKGTVDAYRAAVSAWVGNDLRITEEAPFDRPVPDNYPDRSFLSVILEPAP